FLHLTIAHHIICPHYSPHTGKGGIAILRLWMVPSHLPRRIAMSMRTDNARQLSCLPQWPVQASGDVHARKTLKSDVLNGVSIVLAHISHNGVQGRLLREFLEVGAL